MPIADQVVAIGASAGGLEPLQEFFSAAPEDSGLAFVVIQHLSPEHPSLMDELLARHTRMPVLRVTEGMEVEPNCVYLIPAKTYMRIEAGKLRLTEQERGRDSPPTPIDVFFESLAIDYKERGSAVVLSGTGSDGSRGIRHVRDKGGRTVAQDATAKFDGMPRAAIETGAIDMILPPQDMPAFLTGQEDEDGIRPSLVNTTPGVYEVLEVMRDRHGVDFAHYKITTVLRRIERRIQLTHATSVAAYLEKLRTNEDEQDKLYRDLLIGVTSFFRDPGAFEILENRVIPEIVMGKEGEQGPRVWVAACATGEEAYSVAMLFHEAALRLGKSPKARIFATDVHRGSIEFSSAGKYQEEQLKGLSAERRERYFTRIGDTYQVLPVLRNMVTFAPHNLLADAPFTRMDLVICRNLLIYFKPSAQQRALGLLHFALNVGGTMLLGSSETLGKYQDEFPPVDSHWRVYRKRRDIRLLMDGDITGLSPRLETASRVMPTPAPVTGIDARVIKAYDQILEDILPAGVLLNDRRELVHTFGRARELLRPPVGRASNDVLDMVTPEVRVPLSAAIVRVTKEGRAARYENVPIELEGHTALRTLEVKPFSVTTDGPPYMLVTITGPVREYAGETIGGGTDTDTEVLPADELSVQKIRALEHELQYARESLQVTVEEMETTNEELNATNEELIASNEELQSTNEELQSVNEELHTVNAEYQQKITELTKLTDDMDNLLACTAIGTLFLDPQMRVRKFTPAVQTHFRLRDQDMGRPLEEITSHLRGGGLLQRAKRVYHTGAAEEFETVGGDNFDLLVRLTPYRTGRGLVDGVVVTLVDITQMKSAERELMEVSKRCELSIAASEQGTWDWSIADDTFTWNELFLEMLGYDENEIEQSWASWRSLIHQDDVTRVMADIDEHRNGKTERYLCEYRMRTKNGRWKWVRSVGKTIEYDNESNAARIMGVHIDVDEARLAQVELAARNKDLHAANLELRELATALDATDDCVMVFEREDFRFRYVNEGATTQLGYAKDEMLIKTPLDLMRDITRARFASMVGPLIDDPMRSARFGTMLTTKDDRKLPVSATIRFVPNIGERGRFIAVASDISAMERVRHELEELNRNLESVVAERTREVEYAKQRFERIIDGSQKGTWEWVVETEEFWFASRFWQLLGYDPVSRPDNTLTAFKSHIYDKDAHGLWESISESLANDDPFERRVRLGTADAGYRWFRMVGVPGVEPEAQRKVLSGSIVDIDDTVRAEERLVRVRRELERRVAERTAELSEHIDSLADRNEQLDQFAHVASHDLRAPLRSIAGNAELAMRVDDEAKRSGHVSRVIEGARRMNVLLDALSAYSSVGRSNINKAEISLDDIMADVCDDLASDIQARKAVVNSGELGTVIADERLMRQVMLNLVANAIKFVDADEPAVSISREERDDEVVIRVQDNGIGIGDEFVTSIFEPFRRLHNAESYPGSGVGLSVCRRVIERHGGQIWVEASSAEGTTFAFSLPTKLEVEVAVVPEEAKSAS